MDIRTSLQGACMFKMYLPYGVVQDEEKKELTFVKITDKVKDEINKASLNWTNKYNIYFMTLGIEEQFKKVAIVLRVTFPGIVKKQFKTFVPTNFYKWQKGEVEIYKMITTKNPEIVEKLAQELLKEAYRFYFMYCNYERVENKS